MINPFSCVFLFLSFIKGEKVQEYVWDTVANAFFCAFTNITQEVNAQTDIKDLKMKGEQGLDDYIMSFERLTQLGGYNINDQAVIDMFIDRLPPSLAINIAKFKAPQS